MRRNAGMLGRIVLHAHLDPHLAVDGVLHVQETGFLSVDFHVRLQTVLLQYVLRFAGVNESNLLCGLCLCGP